MHLSLSLSDFAEDPQEMLLAYRAGVFTGTRATFRSGDSVAVRLPRQAFLTDQGAGDRCHLPGRTEAKTKSLLSRGRSWCGFLTQIDTIQRKIIEKMLYFGPREF